MKHLLDAYCGAGGATAGYQRAGFHVTGVDHVAQPRYCGDEFVQRDAVEFIRDHGREFSALAGSPPCQDHSRMRNATGLEHGTGWLVAETRRAFTATGRPWVIENVPGAPMRPDYILCGCMFGLPGLRRPRWFETSWRGFGMCPPCQHIGPSIAVAGHGTHGREYRAGLRYTQADRERAMGISWMTRDELAQAIPPAFAEFIGKHLIDQVAVHAAPAAS